MSAIMVPMLVRIYAGDVLVAEKADAALFGQVMAAMFPPPCPLCHKTPPAYCCRNTEQGGKQEVQP